MHGNEYLTINEFKCGFLRVFKDLFVYLICMNAFIPSALDQKKALDALQLELWMVVSHCVCARIKPGSSARAPNTLNH